MFKLLCTLLYIPSTYTNNFSVETDLSVALIERDVNELYSRKLINQVKIDQIDAITYSFADSNLEKEVAFKIENNNLFCIDSGESFTVWLLNNFKA